MDSTINNNDNTNKVEHKQALSAEAEALLDQIIANTVKIRVLNKEFEDVQKQQGERRKQIQDVMDEFAALKTNDPFLAILDITISGNLYRNHTIKKIQDRLEDNHKLAIDDDIETSRYAILWKIMESHDSDFNVSQLSDDLRSLVEE